MKYDNLASEIHDLIVPILDDAGYDLFDIVIKRQQSRLLIDISIDRPLGGISIDECAGFNKKFGQLIEEKELIKGGHYISVNSPGIDRPLVNKRDFLRVINREVRVIISGENEKEVEVVGTVLNADDTEVLLRVMDDENKIPFNVIKKATQII